MKLQVFPNLVKKMYTRRLYHLIYSIEQLRPSVSCRVPISLKIPLRFKLRVFEGLGKASGRMGKVLKQQYEMNYLIDRKSFSIFEDNYGVGYI